jgi:hypothetical protein
MKQAGQVEPEGSNERGKFVNARPALRQPPSRSAAFNGIGINPDLRTGKPGSLQRLAPRATSSRSVVMAMAAVSASEDWTAISIVSPFGNTARGVADAGRCEQPLQ